MNTIHHVTLNTGDSRVSPRSEVSEEAIRHLDAIVRGGRHESQGMTIEVHRAKNGASFGIGKGGHTMILGAVVWSEQTADHTWASLCEAYQRQTGQAPKAEQPASIPWLAVMLPASAARLANIASAEAWLSVADLERCIAWTILAQEGLAP